MIVHIHAPIALNVTVVIEIAAIALIVSIVIIVKIALIVSNANMIVIHTANQKTSVTNYILVLNLVILIFAKIATIHINVYFVLIVKTYIFVNTVMIA